MAPSYTLAMSAGRDAANRRMKAAGRTKWNRADYNHAAETFRRIYDVSATLQPLIARKEAEMRTRCRP